MSEYVRGTGEALAPGGKRRGQRGRTHGASANVIALSDKRPARAFRLALVGSPTPLQEAVAALLAQSRRVTLATHMYRSFEPACRALESGGFDAALLCPRIGTRSGLELAELLGGRWAATPILLLRESGGEIEAADAERLALDVVSERELSVPLLERVLIFAQRQHQLQRQLHENARLLREASEDAQEARTASTEFFAQLNHNIRTPLNAILGFSEMMREEMLGPIGVRAYADYAADIHSSGHQLLRFLNQLLAQKRL